MVTVMICSEDVAASDGNRKRNDRRLAGTGMERKGKGKEEIRAKERFMLCNIVCSSLFLPSVNFVF